MQQSPGPDHAAAPPRAPDGSRLYVIGDIHGRADLLGDLLGQIGADAQGAEQRRKVLVYLGDYVDRGEESFEVIEMLIAGPPPGFEAVHLKGNHEEFMIGFHEDGSHAASWTLNGGAATLWSYGVGAPGLFGGGGNMETLRGNFREALPQRHLDFLIGLATFHVEGDYLFAHAGIRPGVPIEEQQECDLLWIRKEFLSHGGAFPKMVVHGHSIRETPDIRANRIGIDTGAYRTDHLTCLVLEGESRRFLQT